MLMYNTIICCFIFFSVFFDKQYFSKLSRKKNLIELNLKSELTMKPIILHLLILDKVHHVSHSLWEWTFTVLFVTTLFDKRFVVHFLINCPMYFIFILFVRILSIKYDSIIWLQMIPQYTLIIDYCPWWFNLL